jgi:hypothetical protein
MTLAFFARLKFYSAIVPPSFATLILTLRQKSDRIAENRSNGPNPDLGTGLPDGIISNQKPNFG